MDDPTRQDIDDMRAWATDCAWRDDPTGLPDADIVAGVQRHYAGGVDGFLRDSAR